MSSLLDRRALEIEQAWQQHNRRSISRSPRLTIELRDRLAEAQNWRCCYRGCRMDGVGSDWNAPSFEHIVPRCRGGTDDEDNLAIACRGCNTGRGEILTPEELFHRQWTKKAIDDVKS